jgi:hypothetical protein
LNEATISTLASSPRRREPKRCSTVDPILPPISIDGPSNPNAFPDPSVTAEPIALRHNCDSDNLPPRWW